MSGTAPELLTAYQLWIVAHSEGGALLTCDLELGCASGAAVLTDLVAQDRLLVEEGNVHLVDPAPTGVPLLDEVLRRAIHLSGPRPLIWWIGELYWSRIREKVRSGLLDAGIAREVDAQYVGALRFTTYPLHDPGVRRCLIGILAATMDAALAPIVAGCPGLRDRLSTLDDVQVSPSDLAGTPHAVATALGEAIALRAG